MLGTLGAAAVVAVDEALERAKGAGGALRGVFGRRAAGVSRGGTLVRLNSELANGPRELLPSMGAYRR